LVAEIPAEANTVFGKRLLRDAGDVRFVFNVEEVDGWKGAKRTAFRHEFNVSNVLNDLSQIIGSLGDRSFGCSLLDWRLGGCPSKGLWESWLSSSQRTLHHA
jgi:hypothetical protein